MTTDNRLGAHTAATNSPTCAALACNMVTAISGRASSETRSPIVETASPVQ